MSLLSRLFGRPAASKPRPPQDPYWQRNADLKYVRLMALYHRTRGLRGQGGVFIVWSQGLRGQWVYCGHAPDLAEAVRLLADSHPIAEWEDRAPLSVTWSPIRADRRDGAVAYLRETLRFQVEDPTLDRRLGMRPEALARAERVPILPPG